MLKQKLFDDVPQSECAERQGRPYSLKWVLKNKGEKVRARLVVREIKKAKSKHEKLEPSDVFSAMPVESLKASVSLVMTERVDKRLQSLFADWNLNLQLSLQTDSSSAKAIASRRRTGKSTRHIQTRMLWLRERVAEKHFRVVKVASESNPADMLTKALGRSNVEEFCAEIGQTEPRAETLDKESKGVKKLKEVKFAVEAIEMDETVKNRFKISANCRNSWKCGRQTIVNQKGCLNP